MMSFIKLFILNDIAGVLMSITKGRKYEIPEKENMANVANVILQKMVVSLIYHFTRQID